MDWKKICGLWMATLLFASFVGLVLANGVALPTASASIVIPKEKQDSIKNWAQQAYGLTFSDLDADIGETYISDNNQTCSVHIYKEGLFDTDVRFQADNNTCSVQARNMAIKEKYEQVAKVYQERLDRTQKAEIGSGSVEVNKK